MSSDHLVGIAIGLGLAVAAAYAWAWLDDLLGGDDEERDERDGWGI